MAAECGVVNKSGAWFTYGEVKLGQGRDKAVQFIKDNPELIDELKEKVLANKGLIQSKGGSKEMGQEADE